MITMILDGGGLSWCKVEQSWTTVCLEPQLTTHYDYDTHSHSVLKAKETLQQSCTTN